MSFKVIDVASTPKNWSVVFAASYDKQEVCVYATVFTLNESITVK